MIAALACLSGAIAIGAAAFGAHGAEGKAAEWLRTGGIFQLIHAVAVVALLPTARGASVTMLAGAAIFGFSLYAMALGAPRWFGAITPIGGVLMIVGWLWAGWIFARG